MQLYLGYGWWWCTGSLPCVWVRATALRRNPGVTLQAEQGNGGEKVGHFA